MKQPRKKYNDEDNMLVNDLRSIVSKARSKAFAAVNYSLVERNWRIGQRIVEEEQNGASRAEYGKHVIEVASAALTEEFGKDSHKTFMSHNTWLADGLQLKNNISCIITTYTSK